MILTCSPLGTRLHCAQFTVTWHIILVAAEPGRCQCPDEPGATCHPWHTAWCIV